MATGILSIPPKPGQGLLTLWPEVTGSQGTTWSSRKTEDPPPTIALGSQLTVVSLQARCAFSLPRTLRGSRG